MNIFGFRVISNIAHYSYNLLSDARKVFNEVFFCQDSAAQKTKNFFMSFVSKFQVVEAGKEKESHRVESANYDNLRKLKDELKSAFESLCAGSEAEEVVSNSKIDGTVVSTYLYENDMRWFFDEFKYTELKKTEAGSETQENSAIDYEQMVSQVTTIEASKITGEEAVQSYNPFQEDNTPSQENSGKVELYNFFGETIPLPADFHLLYNENANEGSELKAELEETDNAEANVEATENNDFIEQEADSNLNLNNVVEESTLVDGVSEDKQPLVAELVADDANQNEVSVDSIGILELSDSAPLEAGVLAAFNETNGSNALVDELNEAVEGILNVPVADVVPESFEVNSVIGASKIGALEDSIITEINDITNNLSATQLIGDGADQDQIHEIV